MSSHTTRSATMLPTPRAAGSKCCRRLLDGASRSSDRARSASSALDSLIASLSDAPGEGRALGPADSLREHDGDYHDRKNAGEHLVEREQIAEPGDRKTDAFRGREELADQDPDQSAADRDARAGDDIGQHARHDHLEVEILLAAAERADDVDQQPVDRADAGM